MNQSLAQEYDGGTCLDFRLTVDDYHRYCYIDDGTKEQDIYIPGIFHTVNPVANDYYPFINRIHVHIRCYIHTLWGCYLYGSRRNDGRKIVNHSKTSFSAEKKKDILNLVDQQLDCFV